MLYSQFNHYIKKMEQRKRIVVIGGGFGGLNFIKHIDKNRYDVVLVDRNNFHCFPPLFYQVASSGLEPGSIGFPFRRELRKGKAKGTRYHMGLVSHVDLANKYIETENERIYYDGLVLAAGTTNNFFGNKKLIEKVYTLKSTAQAIRCRNEILDRLERASNMESAAERKRLLSFVVIGGGPAGVEVAGALGEMKRYILHRDYPTIDRDDVNITLLEGSDKLLGAMSEKSQEDAVEYLRKLYVDVRTGCVMTDYENNHVKLGDGSGIYSGMVIWTAGITGVEFDFTGGEAPVVKGGRLEVDEYSRVKGLDSVYALGDIASMPTKDYPHGHPQLAQVAIQQGRTLAKNLNKGEFAIPFRYKDKGTMATVGRNLAVADIGKFHLRGRIAWWAWMLVHLISMLGMRNKVSVFIDWIWGYFSYGTSLRMLLHPARYPLRWRWGEK